VESLCIFGRVIDEVHISPAGTPIRSAYLTRVRDWNLSRRIPVKNFRSFKSPAVGTMIAKPFVRPPLSRQSLTRPAWNVAFPGKQTARWTVPRQQLNILDILFGYQMKSRVTNLMSKSFTRTVQQPPYTRPKPVKWRLPYIPKFIQRIYNKPTTYGS